MVPLCLKLKRIDRKLEKESCSFCIEIAIGEKTHPKINICKIVRIPCKYINKELKKLYKEEFIRFKKTIMVKMFF